MTQTEGHVAPSPHPGAAPRCPMLSAASSSHPPDTISALGPISSSSPPCRSAHHSQATPSLPQRHPTSGLIWAGTVANSGLEAKAVRLSTASIRGAVAARHRSRFSSLKAPSRAWRGDEIQQLATHPSAHPKSQLCGAGHCHPNPNTP